MGVLEWRSVKGYDGRYLVSNTGFIYSKISNKVLKPNKMNNGYLSVELFKDGKSKRFNSAVEAGRLLKINASHIGENCKKIRKSAGGFCWQYERSVDLSAF